MKRFDALVFSDTAGIIQLTFKDEIIANHEKSMAKEKAKALEEILDQEDNNLPCLVCHL
ncbi:hypothetical protein [Anabaena sp. CS-542/02]|uniref:hypothetical protein n=1 Tax=Anabaena sp. CS-542/02 TaxID=3021719 RepID=UPI00232C7849|nr:hypothetical protein [Anabaena sp. CS-542/02]MDB9446477.1 hypothetical protein [Anabaena sp. CS-542/02]